MKSKGQYTVTVRTSSRTKADAAQEGIAGEAVVIPDRQLERPLAEVLATHAVEHERVAPLRVDGATRHRRLVLAALASLREKSSADARILFSNNGTTSSVGKFMMNLHFAEGI